MKKMVAMVALAAALMIGGSAKAASVDIFVAQTGLGSTSWTISAVALVGTGQIAMVAEGFAAMVLEPLPSISAPDSIRNPTTGALTLTSPAGVDLVPIGGAVLLATLTGGPATCPGGAGPAPRCGIQSGDDSFGFTVLDQALAEPVDYSLTVTPFPIPVPEPATMVLLGLGLAGLAMVRRSA